MAIHSSRRSISDEAGINRNSHREGISPNRKYCFRRRFVSGSVAQYQPEGAELGVEVEATQSQFLYLALSHRRGESRVRNAGDC